MAIKYLTEEQLQGFDKYKYSSVDTSPLSKYLMHPFWNRVVKLFPMWVAPNLLTFMGFLLQVALFFVLSHLDWSFYGNNRNKTDYPIVPNWVWFFGATCQFLGHTLDGIDGKQARRTGSSTPLGELFDHGADSILAGLMPITLYSIWGKGFDDLGGSNWVYFCCQWNIVATFLLSHWEKYLTGVLFLPWGYDFSQLSMALVYLLTGIYGFEVWKGTFLFGIQFNYFFITLVYLGSVCLSIPQSLINIYRAYRDGTGKGRSFQEAIVPGVSVSVLFVSSSLWAVFSPMDILEKETRILLVTFSVIMSNITCRLIISQMSNTLATPYNFLVIPFVAAAFSSCVLDIGHYEIYALYAVFAFSIAAHLHYGVTVVLQLCDHFNIYAFSIQKPPKKNHIK